jgi:hypothetical protein
MSGPRIYLHIDRLVLRGVPAAQLGALVRALHAEVKRQLAVPGMARAIAPARHLPTITATPVTLASGSAGSAMGRSAAAGLVRALTR